LICSRKFPCTLVSTYSESSTVGEQKSWPGSRARRTETAGWALDDDEAGCFHGLPGGFNIRNGHTSPDHGVQTDNESRGDRVEERDDEPRSYPPPPVVVDVDCETTEDGERRTPHARS